MSERLPDHIINQAKSRDLLTVLNEHGVRLTGNGHEFSGPCPVCGGNDRFSINTKKQVFNCRICGATGAGAIDLAMFIDGVDFKQAVAILIGRAPTPEREYAQSATSTHQSHDDDLKNRAIALHVWTRAVDPHGTLVEYYLADRGLELPPMASEVIRFHDHCKLEGAWYPAMVCLVRDIRTNEPQAIIRTALNTDGTGVRSKDMVWSAAADSFRPSAIAAELNMRAHNS
jgi:hypothetical protein